MRMASFMSAESRSQAGISNREILPVIVECGCLHGALYCCQAQIRVVLAEAAYAKLKMILTHRVMLRAS